MRKTPAVVIKDPRKRLSGGLSFMELMISIFILSMVFMFCLPFFITSKYATTKESEVIRATQISQGIIDHLKRAAHSYESPNWYYDVMDSYYGTDDIAAVNAVFFKDSQYDKSTSYILIYPESAGNPPPGDVAKKIMVHLEWTESHGGKPQVKTFDNVSYIAKPAVAFARDPSAAKLPPYPSTTVPTTSTIITTTIATTSIPTTSVPTTTVPTTTRITTTRVTSTRITTTATTSIATTSIPTTSVATTSIATTSVPTTTIPTSTRITSTRITSIPTSTVATTTIATTSTIITTTSEGEL